MDNFFKYANAAQKAIRTGVTSAHKEFFQNLDSNTTKLEFVVGEESQTQNGGGKSPYLSSNNQTTAYSRFGSPGKCCGPYWEYNQMNGGAETTQGSPNCPASNPTMDELVWNNRYVYGKNSASGWGGKRKKSKKNRNKKGGTRSDKDKDYKKSDVKEIQISKNIEKTQKNFNNIFNDRNNLILFYNPGCIYCRELNETYRKIGTHYKDKNVNVFAFNMFQALENNVYPPDIFDIKGYPTIFFIKNSSEITTIKYEGNRTFEDIKSFIERNNNISGGRYKSKKNKRRNQKNKTKKGGGFWTATDTAARNENKILKQQKKIKRHF